MHGNTIVADDQENKIIQEEAYLWQKRSYSSDPAVCFFARNLVRALLTFEAFRDLEVALVDINETNLARSKKRLTGPLFCISRTP